MSIIICVGLKNRTGVQNTGPTRVSGQQGRASLEYTSEMQRMADRKNVGLVGYKCVERPRPGTWAPEDPCPSGNEETREKDEHREMHGLCSVEMITHQKRANRCENPLLCRWFRMMMTFAS